MTLPRDRAPARPEPDRLRADYFNRECRCNTLDWQALLAELLGQPEGDALVRMLTEERPHLFATAPIFVPAACVLQQQRVIEAVERVVGLDSYRDRVLTYAPAAARCERSAQGVFLGYDFHLGPEGSRLIEINTNAGGPLLNALLLRAQNRSCRFPGDGGSTVQSAGESRVVEDEFWAMFREEWRRERGDRPLQSIAIVDDDPPNQFLYPEFCLFRNLFRAHGVAAVICDPSQLRRSGGELRCGGQRIDLVYNRLTDFGLDQPGHAELRAACLEGAAVVTPHPRAHALYADKRNLALLTDPDGLRELGVDAETREVLLAGIAQTRSVRREDAETLWARRRQLFFKPAAGYGSRAAYRGDKITRRVFEEVLAGDYVVQTLTPPSARRLAVGAEPADFKLDLRHFVYGGRTQMIVSRLYQGQTTNFRTPGGGFAAVVVVAPEQPAAADAAAIPG